MNRPHKFVTAVTAEQVAQLEALWRHGPSPRVRMRAHSLLLSTRGWSMDAISTLYDVHRQTVSAWLDRWQHTGVTGLADRPRSGKPPRLTAPERTLALALIATMPHAPRQVLAHLTEQTGKTISRSTFKRLTKAARLRWKRVRHATAKQPDPHAVAQAQQELTALKKTSGRSH